MCTNCAALLQDVDVDKPDEKSIMTYVAQFLKHYPNPHHSEADGQHDEVIVFVAFNLTMKFLCRVSCVFYVLQRLLVFVLFQCSKLSQCYMLAHL